MHPTDASRPRPPPVAAQLNEFNAEQRTRPIIARLFEGRSATASCLGAPVGFCWQTRLLCPLLRWPEGSVGSSYEISVTAVRASDGRVCPLLQRCRMSIEQVERATAADEQIIDAIVSTRVPVLRHVFDRPGFTGSALRLKARATPLLVRVGEDESLRWHFELLFLFCDQADGRDEGEEESCALDQDSALAVLDALRWT